MLKVSKVLKLQRWQPSIFVQCSQTSCYYGGVYYCRLDNLRPAIGSKHVELYFKHFDIRKMCMWLVFDIVWFMTMHGFGNVKKFLSYLEQDTFAASSLEGNHSHFGNNS
jgi:hypothetical protein